MKRWTLKEWLRMQFGPRPARLPIETLAERMRDTAHAAMLARVRYEECRRWDDRAAAALAAWQIGDGAKRCPNRAAIADEEG